MSNETVNMVAELLKEEIYLGSDLDIHMVDTSEERTLRSTSVSVAISRSGFRRYLIYVAKSFAAI